MTFSVGPSTKALYINKKAIKLAQGSPSMQTINIYTCQSASHIPMHQNDLHSTNQNHILGVFTALV